MLCAVSPVIYRRVPANCRLAFFSAVRFHGLHCNMRSHCRRFFALTINIFALTILVSIFWWVIVFSNRRVAGAVARKIRSPFSREIEDDEVSLKCTSVSTVFFFKGMTLC